MRLQRCSCFYAEMISPATNFIPLLCLFSHPPHKTFVFREGMSIGIIFYWKSHNLCFAVRQSKNLRWHVFILRGTISQTWWLEMLKQWRKRNESIWISCHRIARVCHLLFFLTILLFIYKKSAVWIEYDFLDVIHSRHRKCMTTAVTQSIQFLRQAKINSQPTPYACFSSNIFQLHSLAPLYNNEKRCKL